MMAEQQNTEELEIRLKVKRSVITAKKNVLKANCGYFRTMFSGKFRESEEVDLSCVAEDISVMKRVVRFFNGKSLSLKLTSVIKIIKVAYFLQAQALIDYCLQFIQTNIDLENAMRIYLDLKEMDLTVSTLTNVIRSRFHDFYVLKEAIASMTTLQLKHAANEGFFKYCTAGNLLRFIHSCLATDLTAERVKVCKDILSDFDVEKSFKKNLYDEFIPEIESICSSIESLEPPSDLKADVDDLVSVLKKMVVDLKEKVDEDEYEKAIMCVVPDITDEYEDVEMAHLYMYIPSSGVWYKFEKALINDKPAVDEDDEYPPIEHLLEEPALKEFLAKSGEFWLHRCKVSENSLIASSDSDIAYFRISIPDMCVTKVAKNPYRSHNVCKGIVTTPLVLPGEDILLVTKLYYIENLGDDDEANDREGEISYREGGIYVDELHDYNRDSVDDFPIVRSNGQPGDILVTEFLPNESDDDKFIVFDSDNDVHFINEELFDVRSSNCTSTTFFSGIPAVLCPQKSDRYAILEVGEKTWVSATVKHHSCKIEKTKVKSFESMKIITDTDLCPRSMSVIKLATTYGDSLWVFEGGNTMTGITSLTQFRVNGAMDAEEIVHTPPPFQFCLAMFANEWHMSSFRKSVKPVGWSRVDS